MAYSDFSYERAEEAFGLSTVVVPLFPGLASAAVPPWLPEQIARNRLMVPFSTEKARSESVVMPVLTALREMAPGPLALFSGHRLDVDPDRGLSGECDYILARTEPVPRLRAPLLTVVEAKRADVTLGIGQCVAQMLGVRLFNERAGEPPRQAWGCVTSGDDWQFLRVEGASILFDAERFYLNDLGRILAALVRTLSDPPVPGHPAAGA